MSLFASAVEKKKAAPKSKAKKKATLWIADGAEAEAVGNAVKAIAELRAEQKAIEAKMELHKTVAKKYAAKRFVEEFAGSGVFPETPMKVQNADGQAVTYVVQDRSVQYQAKDEQVDALTQILGEDAANDMVAEETIFKFSREAMVNPAIMEVLEKHLGAAVAELQEAGEIEEFTDIVDVDQKRAFKHGTLQRLGMICGSDTGKMEKVLDALGSSCVRYIKA